MHFWMRRIIRIGFVDEMPASEGSGAEKRVWGKRFSMRECGRYKPRERVERYFSASDQLRRIEAIFFPLANSSTSLSM